MARRERFEGSAFNTKIASILCMFLLVGCGSGGGGGGNDGGGGPSGIGPNGGTASSSDGRASVTIPAGALSQDTAIAVAVASNPPAGNIGTAYDFGPDGTTFSQPVAISITYDDAALPSGVAESSLRLGTVTNNQWIAVTDATVDTAANVVSGTTTHFSVYGVIAVSDSGVVPAAPTGVRVAAGDGQVTLTWALVPDATSYNVYMASQSGVTKSNYGTLTGGMAHTGVTSPFVHTGLTNGTTYYFVVTAVNASGESTESSEGSGTPVPAVTIPGTPSNLQATAVSSTQINLAWIDHAANEDGFHIERKIGAGGTYSQIATVGTNITNYSDTAGLAANTAYCYHVRAFNGVGTSTYSNESCATTPPSVTVPSAPTLVTATPGDGQITMAWHHVSGAVSYNLYFASQGGVTKSNYTTLIGGTKLASVASFFTRTGLTNGTTYYVVVTAVNTVGESAESIEVSGTPTGIPTTGTFSPTGSMVRSRIEFAAALLSSGKVLIAGGDGFDLAGAELYDPATGTFSSTGSLGTARARLTATPLPNGKVLIAGGRGTGFNSLASAELYDPATGTFRFSGGMRTARATHTATLLSNGKVLIAGGLGGSAGPSLASAELYDPATGTFSSTGAMGAVRYDHTATLLSNGKVLVTGGIGVGGSTLANAELYDLATRTFSYTGSMGTPRRKHTATLLSNGKVLIAGGGAGGYVFASVELYDPATGTFSPTINMGTARSSHTATLLSSGKVLIAGGGDYFFGGSDFYLAGELYDPAAGTFSLTGSMGMYQTNYPTATLLSSGKVLIAGSNSAGSELFQE